MNRRPRFAVFLVAGACLVLALVAIRGLALADSIFQRALASYDQLATVARLEVATNRAFLAAVNPAGQVVESATPGDLLDQLSERTAQELRLIPSARERSAEGDERGQIDDLITAWGGLEQTLDELKAAASPAVNVPDDARTRFATLTGLLTAFEQGEAAEVDAALSAMSNLRSGLVWFLLVLTCIPIALTIWLLRLTTSEQARLELLVQSRTAELAEKALSLEKADRSRKLFFAEIGHELRTPLTAMLAESEIAMRDEPGVGQGSHVLERIQVHGQLMGRRIEDLLALARSEAGELILEPCPVELGGLLERVAALANGHAALAGVPLRVTPADEHVELLADADWVIHALLALVDNAIKASSAAKTAVELSVEGPFPGAGTTGCERISITVQDHGAGVDEHMLPRLTEAFSRSDGQQYRRGSGLGLAMAQWVVREHDGALTLGNRGDGPGFEAVVTLPVL